MSQSMGKIFQDLVKNSPPLQIVGTINAYSALLAQQAKSKAIYLSGAGVANASHGLPDLGMTSLNDVLEDARRITDISTLPLLVDIDTGWGQAFNIRRSIQQLEKAAVAAVHIEDQVFAKRCGHRPNKALVSKQEMGDRIKAAVDARTDPFFVIMARTDAYNMEGLEAAIERAVYYKECGADMIFAEAFSSLSDYQELTRLCSIPILANMTEFGKTPLFHRDELAKVGVKLILYPLSGFRAMAAATLKVYETIQQDGSQEKMLAAMQTRSDLYEVLDYLNYEQILDRLMEEENER